MDLQLKGKKVLVMGASSGIGKAIAAAFIKEGADVAICSRNIEKLEKTAKEIGCLHYFSCDLSMAGQGKFAVEQALSLLGGVDILINNTGGPKKGTILEVTDEQWHEDFQSLWMSVVESMKAALPLMKKNNFGRFILVTSLAAKEPLSGLTTSNGLRAGLAGLCKSVADEYAANGITINLLLPGYTNTERMKELKLSDEKVRGMIPAGRMGDPSELANLAVFLSSPLSGYTTGQSIAVDGGALRGH
ncbi:MAG: SDR family oxidoreductase [Bacteriovorax sp.]|jgi:3-oxoacyl-[acyl-carrier protein] reductase